MAGMKKDAYDVRIALNDLAEGVNKRANAIQSMVRAINSHQIDVATGLAEIDMLVDSIKLGEQDLIEVAYNIDEGYQASTRKSVKKSLNWDDNSPDRMTASCGDLTFVITSIDNGDYYVAEVYGIDGAFPEESFSTLGEAKDWCEGQCGKSVMKSFNSMIKSQRMKNRRD